MKSISQYSCLARFVIVFILSFFSTFCLGQSIYNDLLIKAIEEKKFEDAKYWVEKGGDINQKTSDGKGLLHFAIISEDEKLTEWLIEHGVDINIIDNDGCSPLMYAAYAGYLRLCYLLHINGANLMQKDLSGRDASDWASESGYMRVERFLLNTDTYTSDPTFMEYLIQIENANHDEMLEIINYALSATVNEISEKNEYLIELLKKYAEFYIERKEFSIAKELYIKIIDIHRNKNGDTNVELATFINTLADIYRVLGMFDLAESQYLKALKIREQVLGFHHWDYIETLGSLAVIYKKKGYFDVAIDYFLKAIEICENYLGKNHKYYSVTLNDLAQIFETLGNHRKAESYFLQASDNVKEVFGEESFRYSIHLRIMGDFYKGIGKYDQSEKYYLEAKNIQNNFLEEGYPEYLSTLNNLALLYLEKGDYKNAEQLLIEALNGRKIFFGVMHPDYASTLSNLGLLYKDLGNYERAEVFLIESLSIKKEIVGIDSTQYVTGLNNLALLYYEIDDILNCEKLLSDAYNIRKRALKTNPPDKTYALSINNLARINSEIGNYEISMSLYQEALEVINELFGDKNELYGSVLSNLGLYYMDMGKYGIADTIFKESLLILKESVSENHPTYTFSLRNKILNDELRNNESEAEMHFLSLFRNIKINMYSNFSFLNEIERQLYWNSIKDEFEVFYPSFLLRYFYIKPNVTENFYENVLFVKSILLHYSKVIQHSIWASNDLELINDWNNYIEVKHLINLNELKPIVDKTQYEKLYEESYQLDKRLTQKSQIYRNLKEEFQIGWNDVQTKLNDEEAAIEFISFKYWNKAWTDSIIYCALIVKKEIESPMLITLFEQKQLDSLLVGGSVQPDYLYAARGAVLVNNQQFQSNGEKLYNLIWKPLEKELEGIKTVYYSPSGTLHQIAFAALPIDDAYMLCEKFNLVQLSSTRQLATEAWHITPAAIRGAALFGGIKYDLEERDFLEMQKAQTPNEYTVSRSFISDSTFRSQSFSFLHGSLAETAGIAETFENVGINATAWTGIYATEETFKSLSNQNFNVLHIATHGYFYPNLDEKPETRERFILSGEQRFRHAPNPLLRSGLIMAGGNHAWKGNEPIPGLEDGILTAAEIADMNLTNVDLVVLSACETGLGDINGSEGVFGLQRAFKLAGAKTIIMSLWKVPDAETSEMMQSFYRKWLGGMDKREAFRVTQREMLGKYPNQPHKWAGFVMVD